MGESGFERTEAKAEPDVGEAPERAAAQPDTAKGRRKVLASALEPRVDEEIGGPQGPEPTRFGDWERKGRCIDF
jgi:hypothetical protein